MKTVKFYAVKKGRKPGIYKTWVECQANTNKYTDAVFKSFKTEQEAIEYMNSNPKSNHFNHVEKKTRKTLIESDSKLSANLQCIQQTIESINIELDSPNSMIPQNNEMDTETQVIVYTDGCCLGNGTNNTTGGIGVYFPSNNKRNISEPIHPPTTNNKCELLAVIKALEIITEKNILIYTDSQYVQKGITSWIHHWKRNGYKKPNGDCVLNTDLWKRLDYLYNQKNVTIQYVKGHAGIHGNEMADQLANRGAMLLS
jgi:ribonuclease HI